MWHSRLTNNCWPPGFARVVVKRVVARALTVSLHVFGVAASSQSERPCWCHWGTRRTSSNDFHRGEGNRSGVCQLSRRVRAKLVVG